jgi:CheY-like chemotaxis protein
MDREDVPSLVYRFWSEYREWPALRLTLGQAQRLFDLGEETCRRVVAALWMAGEVRVEGDQVVASADTLSTVTAEHHGGVRVLLIEDDEMHLRGVAVGLEAAGFTVLRARDAGHGTAVALQNPDVIVLDIGLPDSDGHAIARCIRTHEQTSHIPIIFLSARNARDDVARALEVGAADYLLKPCRVQTLIDSIKAALRLSRQSPVASRQS